MPQKTSTQNRLFFLDHIRIFLCIMVIMLHTAITYGANGGWFHKEVANADVSPLMQLVYQIFNTVTQAYSMGFFFLIAGYFTAPSLIKKGTLEFLKDKLIRLGIPLALFATILAPLTIGLARLMQEGGTLLDGVHWIWGMGHYQCGPLWFVQTLLIFSLIYALWKAISPKKESKASHLPSHLSLLIAGILVGLVAFTFRLKIPVGENVFGMQLGYFASYIALFFVGCRAYHDHWLEKISFKYALPWAIVSLISIMLLPMLAKSCSDGSLFNGGWNIYAFMYAMWEPFAAWGIILLILYITRRFLSGTTPFFSGLARCSYAVYVIHPPVLVGLTLLSHNWVAAPGIKWLVVGLMTCIACWGIAAIMIKLPGLRRVF